MTTVSGKIAYLNEKNYNGKTLYSIKLDGDDAYYGCGVMRPKARKGDYVTFEYEEGNNGRLNVDVKTIKVKEAQVVTAGTGRDSYWDKKSVDDKARQNTIEYQAARNSAIAAVGVILNAGAFKLPAKEADKYGAVVGLINDLTNKYYSETKTLGKVVAETPQDEATPAEGSPEMPEDWE